MAFILMNKDDKIDETYINTDQIVLVDRVYPNSDGNNYCFSMSDGQKLFVDNETYHRFIKSQSL